MSTRTMGLTTRAGEQPYPPLPPGGVNGPIVFAHRGASCERPENTLPAFARARELGAALELDLRGTRDGQVVVMHDATLDRTTNGHGDVRCLTLAEVQRLDAGAHFVDAAGQRSWAGRGVKVPTLEEVLRAFPNVPVNIDVQQIEPCIVGAVVGLVRQLHAEHTARGGSGPMPWVLTSENSGVKRKLEAARPPCSLGLCRNEVLEVLGRAAVRGLLGERLRHGCPIPARLTRRAFQIPADAHADVEKLMPSRLRAVMPWVTWTIRRLLGAPRDAPGALPLWTPLVRRTTEAASMPVHVWEIDDPRDAVAWIHSGAAGLFTNDPATVGAAVGAR